MGHNSVPTDGWMTPNEPQGHWNGTAEPIMARKAYQSWYHMLHPHQKVMVLPGLFGWNTSIVSEEVQVRASSFQQVAVPGRALSSLLCAADSGAAGQAAWLLVGNGPKKTIA